MGKKIYSHSWVSFLFNNALTFLINQSIRAKLPFVVIKRCYISIFINGIFRHLVFIIIPRFLYCCLFRAFQGGKMLRCFLLRKQMRCNISALTWHRVFEFWRIAVSPLFQKMRWRSNNNNVLSIICIARYIITMYNMNKFIQSNILYSCFMELFFLFF